MNESSPKPLHVAHFMLPLGIIAWVAYHALPSMLEAWTTDLYARGAATAMVIWLLSLIWLLAHHRELLAKPCHTWLAISLALCLLGVLCNLNFLLHLALAASISGILGLRFYSLTSVTHLIAAASWLPASGWLLSRLFPSELTPWIRPSSAIIMGLLMLAVSKITIKPPSLSASHD